jgi:hypothetical protein
MVEDLDIQCPKCGMFLTPHATKCLFCLFEIQDAATEDESVNEILEDLNSVLKNDSEEAKVKGKVSSVETKELPEEAPEEEHRTSVGIEKKVIYRKVKEGPP